MNAEFTIRRMQNTAVDLLKLQQFLKEIDPSFPVPLSAKTDLDQMAEKVLRLGAVFAAEASGEMAGVVTGYANNLETRAGYIAVLGIASSYRSAGLGGRLVQAFREEARSAGMERITLFTHQENYGAIRFYQRQGFVIDDAIMKNYDCDVALRMNLLPR